MWPSFKEFEFWCRGNPDHCVRSHTSSISSTSQTIPALLQAHASTGARLAGLHGQALPHCTGLYSSPKAKIPTCMQQTWPWVQVNLIAQNYQYWGLHNNFIMTLMPTVSVTSFTCTCSDPLPLPLDHVDAGQGYTYKFEVN